MSKLEIILVALVAIEHIYILWVEMFGWQTKGPKIFSSFPKEHFEVTKELAANMGLYNGFLAAGLIWSLTIGDVMWANNIASFFLSCVVIAGLYGALTAEKGIFFKQAVPAIIALVVLLL